MSYHTFFAFASGVSKTLKVPAGTKQRIHDHIEKVEKTLGLKRTKYLDNPVHWDHFDPEYRDGFPSVNDTTLCETVEDHNKWVRWLYRKFGEWEKTTVGEEEITPNDAKEFWHGLTSLTVSPSRWTKEYYRARMEALYEVMRGRETDGIIFDSKALTPRQAADVIGLFSEFLDPDDLRLDVPVGHDYLASSYDGGYTWCEVHGPIAEEDLGAHSRKRCPLGQELRDEEKMYG